MNVKKKVPVKKSFEKMPDDLKERLQTLKDACEMCQKESYASAIERYMKNFQNPVKIMLVGEGNQGKTTLLNGLLGRTVAKEGYGIKTANQNYYKAVTGKEFVSGIGFFDPNAEEIKNEEDMQRLYEQFRKEKNVNVYWSLNLSWLPEDTIIIDTEGFNQYNDHYTLKQNKVDMVSGMQTEYTDLFDQIYLDADIVLWCVNGQHCDSTIVKYQTVGVYNKPIFLVYTCADEDLEDDTLEEIESVEDLLEDMRERLGDIAKDCVKDFAGFAGDKKNPKRREDFLENLRREMDAYISNCQNGVKIEIGERLFLGIHQKILQELNVKLETEYTILQQYYDYKGRLKERTDSILTDYVKRLMDCLDEISAPIDSDEFYYSLYRECERDFNRTYEKIRFYYDLQFEEKKAFHEIIDEILPEKFKLIEEEFLLEPAFIEEQTSENIEFSVLWDLEKRYFQELYRTGYGIFLGLKPRAFRGYFPKLKNEWKKKIEAAVRQLQTRYEQGFESYLFTKNKCFSESYGEDILYYELMIQTLKNMIEQDEENETEYYLYGLSDYKRVVCVAGEHNQVFTRFAKENHDVFTAESILMSHYLEKDFVQYKLQIKKFFDGMKQNPEEVYMLLESHELEELLVLPDDFEQLPSMQKEQLALDKAVNFERERVQNYYLKRLGLLSKEYDLYKKKTQEIAYRQIQKNAYDWVMCNITQVGDYLFQGWNNGFLQYLVEYREDGQLEDVVYYDFSACLKQGNEVFFKLYSALQTDEWENVVKENLLEEENFSSIKEKILYKQIEKYFIDLKKRAVEEKKRQYEVICNLNKKIALEIMETYLEEARKVAMKISSFELVTFKTYESESSIREKVKNVSGPITFSEKQLLLKEYYEIKEELYGDFIKGQIYSSIKEELAKAYRTKINGILTSCGRVQ